MPINPDMPPPDNTHPTTKQFLERYDTREQNAADQHGALTLRRGGIKNGK